MAATILLNGWLGNDVLTGGAGLDAFVFSTALGATNVDQITDFVVADDTIRLENAVFTALTGTGTLSAAAFRLGTAAGEVAGAEAVIPPLGSRKAAIPYDKNLYKERNLVERFFNKIKHFRRIATRYEKTALSFAAMLSLVGAVIWLR